MDVKIILPDFPVVWGEIDFTLPDLLRRWLGQPRFEIVNIKHVQYFRSGGALRTAKHALCGLPRNGTIANQEASWLKTEAQQT